jgi:hypothetical protein
MEWLYFINGAPVFPFPSRFAFRYDVSIMVKSILASVIKPGRAASRCCLLILSIVHQAIHVYALACGFWFAFRGFIGSERRPGEMPFGSILPSAPTRCGTVVLHDGQFWQFLFGAVFWRVHSVGIAPVRHGTGMGLPGARQ